MVSVSNPVTYLSPEAHVSSPVPETTWLRIPFLYNFFHVWDTLQDALMRQYTTFLKQLHSLSYWTDKLLLVDYEKTLFISPRQIK